MTARANCPAPAAPAGRAARLPRPRALRPCGPARAAADGAPSPPPDPPSVRAHLATAAAATLASGQPAAYPSDPAQVVHRFLQACRRSDARGAARFVAGGPRPPPVVGGRPVAEGGLLRGLSGPLDVPSRRVLPGLLLRRTSVLSGFRVPPGADGAERFVERVSVAARTGETATLTFALRRGGPGGGGGRWAVESVSADAAGDDGLPSVPHSRAAPEAVVRATLVALRAGDVAWAAKFLAPGEARGAGRRAPAGRLAEELGREPLAWLVGHDRSDLAGTALLSERSVVAEVVATSRAAGGERRASTYVFSVCMDEAACWRVRDVEHVRSVVF